MAIGKIKLNQILLNIKDSQASSKLGTEMIHVKVRVGVKIFHILPRALCFSYNIKCYSRVPIVYF